MSAPTVSVLVAVWNGERFIREAIESIRSQDAPVHELIVVNDGSTDGTAAVLDACPGIRAVHRANAGQLASLNHAAGLATGAFLGFNDADDLWTPGRLAAQLAAFQAEPALDVVFGQVEQFLDPSAPASVAAAFAGTPPVQPSRLHSAMLVRREAFERVGPFREDLRIGGVVDWADRARHAGLREAMLDRVVLRRRIHGANQGLTRKAAVADGYLAVVRAALARRRGTEG